jgi:DNA-directed RNA polymerase I, II, and III subunit RPABC5
MEPRQTLKLTGGLQIASHYNTMIIPVRCMNCGKVLADKWLYYQRRLQELQGDGYGKRTYFDGTSVPNTKEAEVMKELGLTRYCCRKVLLTHVDLTQKL